MGIRTAQLISKKNRKTILFASESSGKPGVPRLEGQHGYGSMSWSLYNPSGKSKHVLNIGSSNLAEDIFEAIAKSDESTSKESRLDQKTLSVLSETFTLKPGEEKEVTFVLGWYFPYLNQKDWGEVLKIEGIEDLKLHYFNRFESADQVAAYICDNFRELAEGTRLWNSTWYDSTLPYWLLDRTFITLNCIASNTLIWLSNNRFWGWEGVECCPGTCTHVWQYAQALAHIFPEVERNFREVTDLSPLGLNSDGSLRHRAEHNKEVAHDGHCGTIMRIYREHRRFSDNSFLHKHYTNIKKDDTIHH